MSKAADVTADDLRDAIKEMMWRLARPGYSARSRRNFKTLLTVARRLLLEREDIHPAWVVDFGARVDHPNHASRIEEWKNGNLVVRSGVGDTVMLTAEDWREIDKRKVVR